MMSLLFPQISPHQHTPPHRTTHNIAHDKHTKVVRTHNMNEELTKESIAGLVFIGICESF